jgi:hypothetical protein
MGQNVSNHPNSTANSVNHANQLQNVPQHQNQSHPNLHGNVQSHPGMQNMPTASLQNLPGHPPLQSHQSIHPNLQNAGSHPASQQQMLHMGSYSQNAPHSVPIPPMNYNQHPLQRSLDVNDNIRLARL